jgi:hypothetical protein
MRRVTVIGLAVAGIVASACDGQRSQFSTAATDSIAEPHESGASFVGTWRLERIERYDQTGARLADFVHPTIGHGTRLGYLMYDEERMAVAVQQEGRAPFAGNVPTPEEALINVREYTAYFGPYSVIEEEGYVSYQVAGSLNPRGTGGETQPFYEFLVNQLVLTPSLQCPDSFLTDRGCGYGTTGIQLRNVWEKLEPSTAEDLDSRFLGFWQIDRIERRMSDDQESPTPQYEQGYLIYMPSGYMAVQLMRPDRGVYDGFRPTAAEAADAMRSYVSYFGPFRVDPSEGVVVHRRDGGLNPNRIGDEVSHSFEFRDGQLILKPPVSIVEGQEVQTLVFWDRLSTVDEMVFQ